MKILVSCSPNPQTQMNFFPPHVMEAIAALGPVTSGVFAREELKAEMRDADLLFGIWGLPQMDDDMLDGAKNLRLIAYSGGSASGVMTPQAVAHGVRVLCGNRLYARSVAEGTLGYMLLGQRRMPRDLDYTRTLGWKQVEDSYTAGLYGKTIGLLGFGMIAKQVIALLQPFGARVLVCSDYFKAQEQAEYGASKVDLDTLFRESDIVSIHESLTQESYHLVNQGLLGLMKPGALLVNTARGAIIHEQALAQALQAGRIRAVLDVYEAEPLAMDSPLRGLENAYLFPHRGGPTHDLCPLVTLELVEDAKRFLRGEEPLRHEISLEYAQHMTNHRLVRQFSGKE